MAWGWWNYLFEEGPSDVEFINIQDLCSNIRVYQPSCYCVDTPYVMQKL